MTDKLFDPTTQGPEHKPPEPYRRDCESRGGCRAGGLRTRRPGRPEKDNSRTANDVAGGASPARGLERRRAQAWCRCCPRGRRLEQGATYVDLRDPARREFAATGEMQVPSDGLYVPRSEVDDRTWNRLLGMRTPERMGLAVRTPAEFASTSPPVIADESLRSGLTGPAIVIHRAAELRGERGRSDGTVRLATGPRRGPVALLVRARPPAWPTAAPSRAGVEPAARRPGRRRPRARVAPGAGPGPAAAESRRCARSQPAPPPGQPPLVRSLVPIEPHRTGPSPSTRS